MAASTAEVPDPVRTTEVCRSSPPATRVTLSRTRVMSAENSGSRWHMSGPASAERTRSSVMTGPGFIRTSLCGAAVSRSLLTG